MDCSKRNILYDSKCNTNESKTFLMQNGMKYMGSYELNVNDQKELRSMLPNFQLKIFHKWMKVSAQQYQNEVIFYPFNYYGSFGQVGYPAVSFQAISPKIKKYKIKKEWLGTDNRIFMKPYIKELPKPLKFCEELFDEDVLTIKQLVKDIGDLNTLIHEKQKKFVLLDDSNISNTFFTELNKNIQSYGTITLQYDYNKKNLINWKNTLSFKINQNIEK